MRILFFFTRHMNTVHIDQSIKKFICDKCPFKAHAIQYLTDHKRQKHGEEAEKIGFSCERCKNNFKNEGFFHHHVCKSGSGKALLSFRFKKLIWCVRIFGGIFVTRSLDGGKHSIIYEMLKLKSNQNWVNVYIFLPLSKVTLSHQKIKIETKQSHGTVQSYQIVY